MKLLALCVLLLPSTLLAQQVCPPGVICDGGVCQIPTTVVVQDVTADSPHVRCMINGSCGSGTICGTDGNGSYVLTNAHVTGTQIGRSVIVDVIIGNGGKRVNGRTVMTGYSSRRMVDFSIVYVEGLSSKRYMQLLKTEPDSAPFATTGSPRCVWPLVTKAFNSPRNYGDGLITGSPDAIGGQSGSAIYNSKGQQIALLTWSMSGRCAGQKTSKLWQVATQRDVSLADPRPDGLTELSDGDGDSRPRTDDGVFGGVGFIEVSDNAADYTKIRPPTSDGIAYVVGSAMEDLPIWYTPGGTPDRKPEPEPDCDCDNCIELAPHELELIEFLRAQEAGLRDGGRQVAIDWLKVIAIVMELIKLIQEGRA